MAVKHDDFLDMRVEQMRQAIESPDPALVSPVTKNPNIMRGLIFPIVIILVWLAITQYRFFNLQSGQTVFVLSEVETLGETDLCPGDLLRFRVNVEVENGGVYQLAMSTWQIGPPATVVFSEGLDMVIAEAREFPIEIEYLIPATYLSPVNGKPTEWSPGRFSRDIAVTATGRNTTTSTRQVPFTIKPGCDNN